jgi:hypothetical protein
MNQSVQQLFYSLNLTPKFHLIAQTESQISHVNTPSINILIYHLWGEVPNGQEINKEVQDETELDFHFSI